MLSLYSFNQQAYYSIAKCVAALTISCPNDGELVVNTFVKDIQVDNNSYAMHPLIGQVVNILFCFFPQSSKVLDAVRLFSLLSLGEIGKHV